MFSQEIVWIALRDTVKDGMTVGGGHTRSNPLEPWHSVAAETNGTNDSVTDIQESQVQR